jgi:hypothetical protein
MEGQISIFDFLNRDRPSARNCMSGKISTTREPEEKEMRLVQDGVYTIRLDGHPCVLHPSEYEAFERVPEGHTYRHYIVAGNLYEAVAVG